MLPTSKPPLISESHRPFSIRNRNIGTPHAYVLAPSSSYREIVWWVLFTKRRPRRPMPLSWGATQSAIETLVRVADAADAEDAMLDAVVEAAV